MPRDATPSGVSTIADLNDPSRTFSRAAAMDVMRARRRETVVNEMTDEEAQQYQSTQEPVTTTKAAADDEDTDASDRAAADARAALEAKAAREPDPPAALEPQRDDTQQQLETQTAGPRLLNDDELGNVRVRVKVNGVEREVSVAELRTTAQKVDAADVYLELARQRVADADKKAAETPATPALPSTTSERPTGVRERVGKAFASTFQGDEAAATEELTAAIEEAVQSRTAPNVVRQAVVAELRENAIQSARANVERNHKDLLDDPVKRVATNHYIAEELKARGVNRLEELSPDLIPQVFDQGIARTRAYFKSTPAAPTVDVSATRREGKRNSDELSTASTRSVSTENAPATTSDVINRMRQARGQPVPT